KHPTLHGWRLLLVQLLTADGQDDGEPVLAIDSLGAGTSDRGIVTTDGAGAREMVKAKGSPGRWMGLGGCDWWAATARSATRSPTQRCCAGPVACWPRTTCAARSTATARSCWRRGRF